MPAFISIHAPTRGATVIAGQWGNGDANFNPRSHERSDGEWRDVKGTCIDFNPRSHERSDHPFRLVTQQQRISIHAPTRGATPDNLVSLVVIEFQSTLPREERREYRWVAAGPVDFNPRSHERSDILHQQE